MEVWPKCWGKNTEVFRNDTVSVNLLQLIKGGVCSLHYHNHKWNKFYLISGKVIIRTELGETELNPGSSVLVEPTLKHQFEALEDSKMIECMFTQYEQVDIIRLVEGYRKQVDKIV